MKKRMQIWLHTDSTSSIGEFTLSKPQLACLWVISLFVIAALTCLGYEMFIGKVVMIDHGHGIVTKFGHMDKFFVKKGEEVNRGEVIGLMGNTGRNTGSHVHYEVRINGTPVNPEKYIVN